MQTSWQYRTEGNQKLLFANSTQALLVYKSPPQPISPRLSRHLQPYLLKPVPLQLTPEIVQRLEALAAPHRPPFRNQPLTDYAELVPDLKRTFGEKTVLVELKPKCVTLCRSKLVPVDVCHVLRKFDVPSYHLRNYLDDMPDMRYMPAKLLGREVREQLTILWKQGARGLKVWGGGEEVLDAIAEVLKAEQACLECIRDVQMMDVVDVLGAELLLSKVERDVGIDDARRMIESFINDEVVEMQDWRSKVSFETAEEGKRLYCREIYEEAVAWVHEMDTQVAAALVAEFLIAAAAKDCSVMIALGKGEEGVVARGMNWGYVVKVVDVGGKDLAKLRGKWVPLEMERVKRVMEKGGPEEVFGKG